MQFRYLNFAATFGLLVLTVYILFIGKALILPLVVALVFWYLIVGLTNLYQKVRFGNWHWPYWLAFSLAIISTALIMYGFFILMAHSIANIVTEAPLYQKKFQQVVDVINQWFGSRLDINTFISSISFSQIFSKLASVLSIVASNFVLILIYLLFLLLEHRTFTKKLKAMCKTAAQYKKIDEILSKIIKDINSYLKIKTALNLLAGLLSYFTLLSFGIDYPEFWAILIFLLHYIPYLGPIAAVVFVLVAVSVQITTLPIYITLSVILIAIQFVVGNVLEPKWMGTRLNLSPIVILLSLAFWGTIWGVPGMFYAYL